MSTTTALSPNRARRLYRRYPGRCELALFALVYLLYDGARWLFVGQPQAARTHAHHVIALERALHVAVEPAVQQALDGALVSTLLANVYLAAQLVVLPGALIWTYRRAPSIYRRLRTTVAGAWLIATPIFALYPVAPPRLAGIGMSDVVSHQAGVALTGSSTIFYNPYAAVPSLHVGLAFAIGIALAASCRRGLVRAAWLLWGPLVTLAVVATGNHYLFDAASGLAVAAIAYCSPALARRAGHAFAADPAPVAVFSTPVGAHGASS